jgi:exopolyphosphatase/guanosine-5'-triphosphate,3'-diphosphate pyrophosphatase
MRVATVDIGTNTVLLLVADQKQDGSLRAVAERATITRLGAGVDQSRRLAPDAVERTCACLRGYGELVADLKVDRVAVVGTSAMRDAMGGAAVAQCVRDALGVVARVLSGDEEALLTFAGATSGLTFGKGQELAVFDIGGGSTELALGQHGRADGGAVPGNRCPDRPALAYLRSFDVGSVRLTERHPTGDPPSLTEVETLVRTVRKAFHDVPQIGATIPVGVAGTMTTLAAVSLGIVPYDGARLHGQRVAREELRAVVKRLSSLTLKDRRNVPGMHPMRADVIVAGGIIALALLDHWEAESVVISDRGVRWGLAEELAGSFMPI